MLPIENFVANFIEETGDSVLYRVTPVFYGENLLAYDAQMEVESINDGGSGLMFNVFCIMFSPALRSTMLQAQVIGRRIDQCPAHR